jgi:hypothetical protein
MKTVVITHIHVLLAEDKQGIVPNNVDKLVSQEGGSEETAIYKLAHYIICIVKRGIVYLLPEKVSCVHIPCQNKKTRHQPIQSVHSFQPDSAPGSRRLLFPLFPT